MYDRYELGMTRYDKIQLMLKRCNLDKPNPWKGIPTMINSEQSLIELLQAEIDRWEHLTNDPQVLERIGLLKAIDIIRQQQADARLEECQRLAIEIIEARDRTIGFLEAEIQQLKSSKQDPHHEEARALVGELVALITPTMLADGLPMYNADKIDLALTKATKWLEQATQERK